MDVIEPIAAPPIGPEWKNTAVEHVDRPSVMPAVNMAERESIQVVDMATGAVEKLGDFMADFFSDSEPPKLSQDQVDRILEQRRALAALENIRDALEDHHAINGDDLRCMHPADLREIKDKGDAALVDIINRMEEQAERNREWGRQREL